VEISSAGHWAQQHYAAMLPCYACWGSVVVVVVVVQHSCCAKQIAAAFPLCFIASQLQAIQTSSRLFTTQTNDVWLFGCIRIFLKTHNNNNNTND
jgi:hypothetical protein